MYIIDAETHKQYWPGQEISKKQHSCRLLVSVCVGDVPEMIVFVQFSFIEYITFQVPCAICLHVPFMMEVQDAIDYNVL